jgi:hypothetical protein
MSCSSDRHVGLLWKSLSKTHVVQTCLKSKKTFISINSRGMTIGREMNCVDESGRPVPSRPTVNHTPSAQKSVHRRPVPQLYRVPVTHTGTHRTTFCVGVGSAACAARGETNRE